MGLFDAFTGAGSKKAAVLANTLATQNQQQAQVRLEQGRQEGIGYIDTAQPQQLGALSDARTASLGNIEQLLRPRARSVRALYRRRPSRRWRLRGQPRSQRPGEGYDRTVGTYQHAPGYDFRVKAETDQAARAGSAIGQLGSGNTVQEMGDRAGHLADEDFSRWQGQVKSIGDRGYDASGRTAGTYTGQGDALAGIETNYGNNVSSIYGGNAANKAGIATNTAGRIATSLTDLSKMYADNIWGAAKGTQQGNANAINFGMNLADMGLKASGIGGFAAPKAKV
jgi:hypothetical protein